MGKGSNKSLNRSDSISSSSRRVRSDSMSSDISRSSGTSKSSTKTVGESLHFTSPSSKKDSALDPRTLLDRSRQEYEQGDSIAKRENNPTFQYNKGYNSGVDQGNNNKKSSLYSSEGFNDKIENFNKNISDFMDFVGCLSKEDKDVFVKSLIEKNETYLLKSLIQRREITPSYVLKSDEGYDDTVFNKVLIGFNSQPDKWTDMLAFMLQYKGSNQESNDNEVSKIDSEHLSNNIESIKEKCLVNQTSNQDLLDSFNKVLQEINPTADFGKEKKLMQWIDDLSKKPSMFRNRELKKTNVFHDKDWNYKSIRFGNSILNKAVQKLDFKSFKTIADHIPDCVFKNCDKNGDTVLKHAILRNDPRFLHEVVSRGGIVPNLDGKSSMTIALRNLKFKSLNFLMRHYSKNEEGRKEIKIELPKLQKYLLGIKNKIKALIKLKFFSFLSVSKAFKQYQKTLKEPKETDQQEAIVGSKEIADLQEMKKNSYLLADRDYAGDVDSFQHDYANNGLESTEGNISQYHEDIDQGFYSDSRSEESEDWDRLSYVSANTLFNWENADEEGNLADTYSMTDIDAVLDEHNSSQDKQVTSTDKEEPVTSADPDERTINEPKSFLKRTLSSDERLQQNKLLAEMKGVLAKRELSVKSRTEASETSSSSILDDESEKVDGHTIRKEKLQPEIERVVGKDKGKNNGSNQVPIGDNTKPAKRGFFSRFNKSETVDSHKLSRTQPHAEKQDEEDLLTKISINSRTGSYRKFDTDWGNQIDDILTDDPTKSSSATKSSGEEEANQKISIYEAQESKTYNYPPNPLKEDIIRKKIELKSILKKIISDGNKLADADKPESLPAVPNKSENASSPASNQKSLVAESKNNLSPTDTKPGSNQVAQKKLFYDRLSVKSKEKVLSSTVSNVDSKEKSTEISKHRRILTAEKLQQLVQAKKTFKNEAAKKILDQIISGNNTIEEMEAIHKLIFDLNAKNEIDFTLDSDNEGFKLLSLLGQVGLERIIFYSAIGGKNENSVDAIHDLIQDYRLLHKAILEGNQGLAFISSSQRFVKDQKSELAKKMIFLDNPGSQDKEFILVALVKLGWYDIALQRLTQCIDNYDNSFWNQKDSKGSTLYESLEKLRTEGKNVAQDKAVEKMLIRRNFKHAVVKNEYPSELNTQKDYLSEFIHDDTLPIEKFTAILDSGVIPNAPYGLTNTFITAAIRSRLDLVKATYDRYPEIIMQDGQENMSLYNRNLVDGVIRSSSLETLDYLYDKMKVLFPVLPFHPLERVLESVIKNGLDNATNASEAVMLSKVYYLLKKEREDSSNKEEFYSQVKSLIKITEQSAKNNPIVDPTTIKDLLNRILNGDESWVQGVTDA